MRLHRLLLPALAATALMLFAAQANSFAASPTPSAGLDVAVHGPHCQTTPQGEAISLVGITWGPKTEATRTAVTVSAPGWTWNGSIEGDAQQWQATLNGPFPSPSTTVIVSSAGGSGSQLIPAFSGNLNCQAETPTTTSTVPSTTPTTVPSTGGSTPAPPPSIGTAVTLARSSTPSIPVAVQATSRDGLPNTGGWLLLTALAGAAATGAGLTLVRRTRTARRLPRW